MTKQELKLIKEVAEENSHFITNKEAETCYNELKGVSEEDWYYAVKEYFNC